MKSGTFKKCIVLTVIFVTFFLLWKFLMTSNKELMNLHQQESERLMEIRLKKDKARFDKEFGRP